MVSGFDLAVYRERILTTFKGRRIVSDISFVKSPSSQHSCRSEQSHKSLASPLPCVQRLPNILPSDSTIGCDSTNICDTKGMAVNGSLDPADQCGSEVGTCVFDRSNTSPSLNVSGHPAPLYHRKETVASQSEAAGITSTPEHPSCNTLHPEHVEKMPLDFQYSHEGVPSFNAIPQERAAECEYQLVDTLYLAQTRPTSFQSFTPPFHDTHAEITRPLYSRNNPQAVDGFSIHNSHNFASALDIYPSSAQGKDPLLHPYHAEIIAPHLEKNSHDGYSVLDLCPTQNFEAPSIPERSQEIDTLRYPTPSEITALQLEKNPYDGYPVFDLCSTQSFETPSTLERSQASDPSLCSQSEIMAPYFENNPCDGYSVIDLCPTQNFETLSTLETDPLLHPIHAEVTTENNLCDGRSINDSCLIQSFAIPRMFEVYPNPGSQETIYPRQKSNAPYIQFQQALK